MSARGRVTQGSCKITEASQLRQRSDKCGGRHRGGVDGGARERRDGLDHDKLSQKASHSTVQGAVHNSTGSFRGSKILSRTR